MICKNCGADIDNDSNFCQKCGKKVENETVQIRFCMKCGKPLDIDEKFCGSCGTQVAVIAEHTPHLQGEVPPKKKEPKLPKEPKETKPAGKKRGVNLVLTAIAVILIAGAAITIMILTSPVNKFKNNIAASNYSEAMAVFSGKIRSADDVQKAYEFLASEVGKTHTGFVDETIDYTTAISKLNSIESLKILHGKEIEQARSSIEELNQSRTAYSTAKVYFDAQQYDKALAEYKKVILSDKNYNDAQAKIAESANKYREISLGKAKQLHTEQKFAEEKSLLNEALSILPGDSDLTTQASVCETSSKDQNKQELLNKAQNLADSKQYEQVIELLKSAMSEYPNDSDIMSKLSVYSTNYVDSVLAEATSLSNERKFEEAIAKIKSGLTILPNEDRFNSAIAKYDEYLPVSLVTINYLYKGYNTYINGISGSEYDNLGNEYINGFYFYYGYYADDDTNTISYMLDSKYTQFTGKWALRENSKNAMSETIIKIYGDNKLLYTSPVFKRGFLPVEFSINITGVKILKIECDGTSETGVIMANPNIYAKY